MDEIIRFATPMDTVFTVTPTQRDELPWPIAPAVLVQLYLRNSDHARACQIKAEGIAGRGWQDAPPDVAALLPIHVLTRLALDLETFGNAFAERQRDRAGRLLGLKPLPAQTIVRLRNGGLRQRFWENLQERVVIIPERDALHLQALCPLGYDYAVPSWAGARGMIDLIWAATRYNARYFEGGAIPEYAIVHTGASLSLKQRGLVREFFRGEYLGVERSRRTLFLSLQEGQTVEFRPIAQHQEGEFLKLMDAARLHLPSAHGVPPRLLGIMTPGQLGGVGEAAQQMFMFEQFTLAPRRRQLVDQLAPVWAELNVEAAELTLQGVDLTPPGDDAKDLPALVNAGVISPEEGRERLGLTKTDTTAELMAELLLRLES